ncbi:IS3 family transposase [Bacillus cereus]|uniref:IS3 family transposase n=1 Tax=Bacillus cereus TaxID=1396 RepID=UPI00397FEF7F
MRAVRRDLNSNEGGKAIFAKYIEYYNHKRIKTKLKEMSPGIILGSCPKSCLMK